MIPRTHPAQTRLRLLTAAAEEMVARGYSAATLSIIAGRLGLTKGAFGYHFRTKQAIADAIIEHANCLAMAAAARAEALFPLDAARACIAFFAGLARDGATDPIARAALLMYQDRAVPLDVVVPAFENTQQLARGFLGVYVERDGGRLHVSVEEAARLLHLMVSGELVVARFIDAYSEEESAAAFAIALTGLGIPDARTIVMDGIRAVWTEV